LADLDQVLVGFLVVAGVVIVLVIARPSVLETRGGKALAFLGWFLLPVLALAFGVEAHLERAKSTDFCLSCHVMEPYGESLWLDDSSYLPASHVQNHRVDPGHACYSCHADYTLFGGVEAKMTGMKHLWIYYTGQAPPPGEIELYEPFSNSICLHCHGGARSFEEGEFHDGIQADLRSGEMSCLDCHDQTHAVEELADLDKWHPSEDVSEEAP
jgi:NapC/NirT cytochrome c family, N-terminal region